MGGADRSTVLIVDDDWRGRELVRAVLEPLPLVVVAEATNGAEAVWRARELQPDLVTIDLEMPVVDGVAATRAIRQLSQAAVIIVSGNEDNERADAAIAAGAHAFVAKANLADELPALVRRLL